MKMMFCVLGEGRGHMTQAIAVKEMAEAAAENQLGALDDGTRQRVRAHAAEYGVDPHRIGLMGFSAGGELVSLEADNPAPPSTPADAVDRVSARPDFQVLIYPGPLGVPARAVVGAPPAFLAAGTLDTCCALPTLTLYQQLRAAGVSAELHLFADTDHGFNVAMHSERVSIAHWPDRLMDWLSDGGWLTTAHGLRSTPSSWPSN